jgi:hypothetical protein
LFKNKKSLTNLFMTSKATWSLASDKTAFSYSAAFLMAMPQKMAKASANLHRKFFIGLESLMSVKTVRLAVGKTNRPSDVLTGKT